MEIRVNGPRWPANNVPLWRAKLEVLEWEEPKDHRTIRSLFINRQSIKFGRDEVLLPGTMIVRGQVAWVRLFPIKDRVSDDAYLYKWEGGDMPPYEVVLLVQAIPEEWKVNDSSDAFPDLVCLAGEILTTRLKEVDQSKRNWKGLVPDVTGPANLSVHSSGLSLDGSVLLPWERGQRTIPCPLLVEAPFPQSPAVLRMTLDRERVAAEKQWEEKTTRSLFVQAFQRLSSAIHPEPDKRPQWAALDLINQTGIPKFYWSLQPQKDQPVSISFHVERGEINLLISDQPNDRPDVMPRALLTVAPEITFKISQNNPLELSLLFADGGLTYGVEADPPPPQNQLPKGLNRLSINDDEIIWQVDANLPGDPDTITPVEKNALQQVAGDAAFSPSFRASVDRLLAELEAKSYSRFSIDAIVKGGVWAESAKLRHISAQYDALGIARQLRQQHNLPVPDAETAQPAILWGFVPLEDGWAQLPFLNLTEQHYIDALPPKAEKTETALLSGAASFGNDTPELLALDRSGEQTWNITLLDGNRYAGQWQLSRADEKQPWSLNQIQLSIAQPELVMNGLFLLGTQTPTAANALPSLDDWLGSVSMISLRTLGQRDRFASPFVLQFADFGFNNHSVQPEGTERKLAYPELQAWNYSYQANSEVVHKSPGAERPARSAGCSVFETLLLDGLLNALARKDPEELDKMTSSLWQRLPLVWRRHPKLPVIQSLPLTQTQVPPNFPSPSRQLAPFKLDVEPLPNSNLKIPRDWRFGVESAPGAASWPRLLSSATPADVWQKTHDPNAEPSSYLYLASLSIPGLIFDPNLQTPLIQPPDDFLQCQYLYGLPYTDELNALAQSPKEGQREQAPQVPAVALRREDYEDHWTRLSEMALLARVDADELLTASTDGKVFVNGLIEPFKWAVSATLASSYPGQLTLSESESKTISLSGLTALEGVTANFNNDAGRLTLAPASTAAYTVIAGSMSAAEQSGEGLRDQRGLTRFASSVVPVGNQCSLVKTPVRFESANEAVSETLYSLVDPLPLAIGKDDTLRLWFRDLATREGIFSRASTLSANRRGVNDPAADLPPQAYRTGYEWRLNAVSPSGETPELDYLPFLGFHFFPLTLETVQFGEDDQVTEVAIVGRLQLPSKEAREQADVGNAITLTFIRGADSILKLATIESAGPDGEPDETPGARTESHGVLTLDENAIGHSLRWNNLRFDADRQIVIEDARLEFAYFGIRWLLPATPITFERVDTGDGRQYVADLKQPVTDQNNEPIRLDGIQLNLVLTEHKTTARLKVDLSFWWGSLTDLRLKASVSLQLLPVPTKDQRPEITASLPAFPEVNFQKPVAWLIPGGIQMNFSTVQADSRRGFQVLPGMLLSGEISGFAMMSFSIGEVADSLPNLTLTSGFAEAIFPSRWGRQLQQSPGDLPSEKAVRELSLEGVFGSSAGHVDGGYTLNATANGKTPAWEARLLLNGLMEVKNLLSWPTAPPDLPEDISTIGFEFSHSQLSQDAERIVARVADFLREHPTLQLRIEGHADAGGGSVQNKRVSENRAKAVRKELVEAQQIDGTRLSVIGFGETRLKVPTNAPEPRNRRVEMRRAPIFSLAPVRPAGQPLPPLHHIRHTIRVMFNQHEVPAGVLQSHAPDLLFDFAPNQSWQLIAVVEHQLVDVEMNSPTEEQVKVKSLSHDRRWVAVQEVRLVSPSRFSSFLNRFNGALKTVHPATDKTKAVLLKEKHFGYQRAALLDAIISGGDIDKLKASLLVEASAPFWINGQKEGADQFTNLQYLPAATQRAILSVPEDFYMKPEQQESWLLLSMPFLGRLQGHDKDGIDGQEGDSKLQVDPILYLDRQRRRPSATLSIIPLALASWENTKGQQIALSEFDLSDQRRMRRIDPATLEESWFRLQHPPEERGAQTSAQETSGSQAALPSVMAAVPVDSPGRLSRPKMLERMFDEVRGQLPPNVSTGGEPLPPDDEIEWRRNNLFVMQGFSDLGRSAYGFFFTGAQLHTSNLNGDVAGTTRHAAATLIPANLRIDNTQENQEPVSFAVSPYLGLDLREMADTPKLLLTFAELVCLNADLTQLTTIATQAWQNDQGTDENIQTWGREIHSRLAPDSPVAVLRIRKVKAADTEAASRASVDVTIAYQFLIIPIATDAPRIERTRPIRTGLTNLRFAEGQYGAVPVPRDVHAFEISPPETRGFQPLYLNALPLKAEPGANQKAGMSAMRFTVRYTEAKCGVVGSIARQSASGEANPITPGEDSLRLWWTVASHTVQFALPKREKLLPRRFRAKAIRSLLPALPQPPLPKVSELVPALPKMPELTQHSNNQPQTLEDNGAWQPILPGAYNYFIVGARAGAPLMVRNFVIVQSGSLSAGSNDVVFCSGAIPVQHRVPRPIHIPANSTEHPEFALRTWASSFDPEMSLLQTSNPADNAFLATASPLGVMMELVSPAGGVIGQDANGELLFKIERHPENSPDNWVIEIELVAEGRSLKYARSDLANEQAGRYSPVGSASSVVLLKQFLAGLRNGALAVVRATLENKSSAIEGYKQTLSFPLRVANGDQIPAPLEPVYGQFEDPEYNRRLASQTAQNSRTLRVNKAKAFELTLVTDRREYNSTSEIVYVLFGDNWPEVGNAFLTLRRMKRSGERILLVERTGVQINHLERIQLASLSAEPLIEGDVLLLSVEQPAQVNSPTANRGVVLEVRLNVVVTPVVPAPEAGYALLCHRQAPDDLVECRRFAWAPSASRVEMIDPDDLKRGIVRRRAVFQWFDIQRRFKQSRYAIQKISFSGSTHFPFDE